MARKKNAKRLEAQAALLLIEEEQRLERKSSRCIVCGAGNLHIIASCPRCYSTQGGLLAATVVSTFKGVTKTWCAECANTVNYYVDATEKRVWSMESVEARMGQISH